MLGEPAARWAPAEGGQMAIWPPSVRVMTTVAERGRLVAVASVWLAVVATVLSGFVYVGRARKLLIGDGSAS